MPAVTAADLMQPRARETSTDIRDRVARARAIQSERYAGMNAGMDRAGAATNATVSARLLEEVAALGPDTRSLMIDAAERIGLSARGYHRVLRVARTLADLDASVAIQRAHVAEALSYRARSDRMAAAA